ncbi:GNAT family N-acetyltransferase [Pedobacter sp. ASV28]|uniref:GNAT family N-acetyltransferase n=1 Tax=Pedobacter sp. ASV28 TaxID=2795123 RepID=UPI0018EDA38D|nr:GNAT family N-acetyltransferase [Pedobacter sp. ASV28]
MNITIVPIYNNDSEAVINIILPIQQNEFNIAIGIKDQQDLLTIEEFYHHGGGHFWGAKIDGELVGTIGLIKSSEDFGTIRKMFVKKEYRGKDFGIAQLLLDTLVTYSKEIGLKDLYLGTKDVLQAALRFYEKNGFSVIHKNELPKVFPIMAVDNVFCRLALK